MCLCARAAGMDIDQQLGLSLGYLCTATGAIDIGCCHSGIEALLDPEIAAVEAAAVGRCGSSDSTESARRKELELADREASTSVVWATLVWSEVAAGVEAVEGWSSNPNST